VERIREWVKSAPAPKLVIVDVLAKIRPLQTAKGQSEYEADYAAIQGLQKLAGEFGIALLVIHHLHKNGSESDPFDKVSGTMGLSGAADTVLVLRYAGRCDSHS
jgi:RecA-family ATPase